MYVLRNCLCDALRMNIPSLVSLNLNVSSVWQSEVNTYKLIQRLEEEYRSKMEAASKDALIQNLKKKATQETRIILQTEFADLLQASILMQRLKSSPRLVFQPYNQVFTKASGAVKPDFKALIHNYFTRLSEFLELRTSDPATAKNLVALAIVVFKIATLEEWEDLINTNIYELIIDFLGKHEVLFVNKLDILTGLQLVKRVEDQFDTTKPPTTKILEQLKQLKQILDQSEQLGQLEKIQIKILILSILESALEIGPNMGRSKLTEEKWRAAGALNHAIRLFIIDNGLLGELKIRLFPDENVQDRNDLENGQSEKLEDTLVLNRKDGGGGDGGGDDLENEQLEELELNKLAIAE